MSTLYVAFHWHQHQPYYMDPVTGRFALPWVRLHGIKDYIGMANLLAEFPHIGQAINFVPSLLRQIEDYACGATDTMLMLSRVPADSLSHQQAVLMLNTFFAANWENMINPYTRYRELLGRCEFSRRPAKDVARELSAADFRDLQVWANLAWFHPTVIEHDAGLAELIRKGKEFTETEKHFVLDRQLETLKGIVPLHRRLAESGQLELTTTPFYHPILPLLCDPAIAQVARPDLELPWPRFAAPEDAAVQVRRSIEHHQRTFGAPPRGMWPAECSVSDAAAAVFAAAGVDWIVTDEDVLAKTLDTQLWRDGDSLVERPELLYRPYRLSCEGSDLNVIFRDRVLSDLIGFRSTLPNPADAARDLFGRLEAARDQAPDNALVTIALDGENCWEYYPDQGVRFLRELYRLLSESPDIEAVRISDYVDRFGPGRDLQGIFPGSWISHSFSTWIGHWEKNRAWEHLARAREFCHRRLAENGVAPDSAAAAQEEIYVAEGSDWFWWYGDDHSSGSDAEFDSLFRKHLRRIYELLDTEPPEELFQPILGQAMRESWHPPRGLINVRVDGLRTSFFEWLAAGSYQRARDVGAIQRSVPVPATAMYFGFGSGRFFLRLDVAEASDDVTVELWLTGGQAAALVARFGAGAPEVTAGDHVVDGAEAARRRVIEIGVPVDALGLVPGQEAELFVRVLESDSVVQRIPASGAIAAHVPTDLSGDQ